MLEKDNTAVINPGAPEQVHILFFDIDGTTYQNNIRDLPASAWQTLQQMKDNGMDKITKHIVGEKPAGYNEYSEMNIDDQTFYGDPGTMVIQVTAGNGKVTASWVKGKGSE